MKRRVRRSVMQSIDRSELLGFLAELIEQERWEEGARLETLAVHSEPAAPEHRLSFTAVFVTWE